MADALKHLYDQSFVSRLARAVHAQAPSFPVRRFTSAVFADPWPSLELKARMRHIATMLAAHVPGPYRDQLAVLQAAAPAFRGFTAMVFPDFVEAYGTGDPDASLPALELFTQYSSSEFAVRPFIVRDERHTMAQMRQWATHPSEHVRRLASEGCRPRLPWAMALPRFKQDPSPILPILELLKADPSEYVRRSVANNLNDIAKDHPEVTLAVAKRWYGRNPLTDALVKHACRTLLKRGDADALAVFGYAERTPARIEGLTLSRTRLAIGETLEFSFTVQHDHGSPLALRVEYHVHFARASGASSRKVFQVAERLFPPGRHAFTRRHAFADLSTRTHHPGAHRLSIALNGTEQASAALTLFRPRTPRRVK